MGWGKLRKKISGGVKNIVSGVVNPVKQIARGDVMEGLGGLAYGTMVNPFMQTGGAMLQSGEAQKLYSGFGQGLNQAGQGAAGIAMTSQPSAPKPQQAMGGTSYPTMANDYGLGQGAESLDPASSEGGMQKPITVNMNDTSSKGFNPWSMMGESNARDGEMG